MLANLTKACTNWLRPADHSPVGIPPIGSRYYCGEVTIFASGFMIF